MIDVLLSFHICFWFPDCAQVVYLKKKGKMKHFAICILGAGQTKLLILISELWSSVFLHKEFSSYCRTTKENFQCISLLANTVCRQVITCPLSFGPKIKTVNPCLQNKRNRLSIWISKWLIGTCATQQTYWAATFQHSTFVRLSVPIPVSYNTICLRQLSVTFTLDIIFFIFSTALVF